MSKWVEIRDAALADIKEGAVNVTESAKAEFLQTFTESAFPVVEQYAAAFSDAVKKQAETESGWNKLRDAAIIPACIKIGVFVFKSIVSSVVSATTTADNTAKA